MDDLFWELFVAGEPYVAERCERCGAEVAPGVVLGNALWCRECADQFEADTGWPTDSPVWDGPCDEGDDPLMHNVFRALEDGR